MSRIFDALQRAEADRTGQEVAGQVKATDVLKRVEQRTASSHGEVPKAAASQTSVALDEKDSAYPGLRNAHLNLGPKLVVAERAEQQPLPTIFQRFATLKCAPDAESKLVSLMQPESAAAEAFRLLAIRLNDLKQSRSVKKVLVTSSIPQEGKSLVAANLVCALSKSSSPRTLLIEGDLRRPTLSPLFEVSTGYGICEYLEGKCGVEECIYFIETAGVWLLPAGRATVNPQDLMKSERLELLIAEVSAWLDWVVIDSPPILPLADTSIWMRIADGILVTARQGKTEKKALKSCIEALDREKLIGAILNSARIPDHADYYYRTSTMEDPA